MDEHLEIERDAVPPKVSKRPVIPDYQSSLPSLTDKLEEHFQFRTSNTMLPDLIAKLAIPIYFFTITTTWYLGMFEVMPLLYAPPDSSHDSHAAAAAAADSSQDSKDSQGTEDNSGSGLLYQRIFMVFLYLEMMVNWVCIRYVDCSYLMYLKKHWQRKMQRAGGGGGGGWGGGRDKYKAAEEGGGGGGGEEEESLLSLLESGRENGYHARRPQENGHHHPPSLPVLTNNSETPWKPPFHPSQQTSYPYWSWVPCYVCEIMRPPRCHHCPICQACVLKRDHHCFFAGSCVGWRNQRHFLFFGIWAAFGCSYAGFYGAKFFLLRLWPWLRWYDLFAPVATVRWLLLGRVSGLACLCVWVGSLLAYFVILSTTFVYEHVQLICRGMTSFEVSSLKKTVELRDSRGLGAKFRSVLGRWWLLNLLLPLHWVFDAQEDPENWPSIKIYRH